jgi:hypothetical protein
MYCDNDLVKTYPNLGKHKENYKLVVNKVK